MRSAEIERIGWDNIRLVTKNDTDRVINLEAGIAKTNSRRTITIHETLAQWLFPHIRPHQPVWPGSTGLVTMVESLRQAAGYPESPELLPEAKVLVIVDAGVATAANLKLLAKAHFHYWSTTRAGGGPSGGRNLPKRSALRCCQDGRTKPR